MFAEDLSIGGGGLIRLRTVTRRALIKSLELHLTSPDCPPLTINRPFNSVCGRETPCHGVNDCGYVYAAVTCDNHTEV